VTRRYGCWAGNERGTPENVHRCIVTVWPRERVAGWIPWQCRFKRGFGYEGLFCTRHARRYSDEKQRRIAARVEP